MYLDPTSPVGLDQVKRHLAYEAALKTRRKSLLVLALIPASLIFMSLVPLSCNDRRQSEVPRVAIHFVAVDGF